MSWMINAPAETAPRVGASASKPKKSIFTCQTPPTNFNGTTSLSGWLPCSSFDNRQTVTVSFEDTRSDQVREHTPEWLALIYRDLW